MQQVTPEELDAWLRSTDVTEEADGDQDVKPSFHSVERGQSSKKTKKGVWRRRSSLDEDNISSRPCFGVDPNVLLANECQDEAEEENNVATRLNPYLKRSSEGCDTGVIRNRSHDVRDYHDDILSIKKRRMSLPNYSGNHVYNRRSSSYSQASCTSTDPSTPYCRLVTDDSFKLDQEAQYSRHSSQYAVPSHTMDEEARYSRRSSQVNVSRTSQGEASFLQAMEVSQRSHFMLFSQLFSRSLDERGRSDAMKESEMSRSLLVKMSRRNVVKSMAGVVEESRMFCGLSRPASFVGQQCDRERVAADLRRMEETLLAEELMRRDFRF